MLEAQAFALLIPSAPGQDMDSAIEYLGRRPLHAGTGSTLKKAHRAQRIAAQKRPLRVRAVRERVIGRTATHERVVEEVLHPTKGWRSNRHFTRKAA